MTIFELIFSLSALILGLALAQLATSFYQLALAGRRVRWAPEPLLLSAIILLVIVFVWLTQWHGKNETPVYWRVLLQVLKLLFIYVAAAACLPAVKDEGMIDLYAHYDDARRIAFGSLVVSMVLFQAHAWTSAPHFEWTWGKLQALTYIIPYTMMMFVRARWFNIVLLAAILLLFASTVMNYQPVD